MAVAEHLAADAELAQLYASTGIDLTACPPIMTAAQLSPHITLSEGALAQDRYRGEGIPFVKMGRRVRYLRADVARYLMANRSTPGGAA
jgi:hypothetical protein